MDRAESPQDPAALVGPRSVEPLSPLDAEPSLRGESIVGRDSARKRMRRRWIAATFAAVLVPTLLLGTAVVRQQAYLAPPAKSAAAVPAAPAEEVRGSDEANGVLKEALRSERQALYAARMSLVTTAWDEGRLPWVASTLNRCRPEPGEEDLRGFEWHLHRNRLLPDRRFPEIRPQTVRELSKLPGDWEVSWGDHDWTPAFGPTIGPLGKRIATLTVESVKPAGALVRVFDAATGRECLPAFRVRDDRLALTGSWASFSRDETVLRCEFALDGDRKSSLRTSRIVERNTADGSIRRDEVAPRWDRGRDVANSHLPQRLRPLADDRDGTHFGDPSTVEPHPEGLLVRFPGSEPTICRTANSDEARPHDILRISPDGRWLALWRLRETDEDVLGEWRVSVWSSTGNLIREERFPGGNAPLGFVFHPQGNGFAWAVGRDVYSSEPKTQADATLFSLPDGGEIARFPLAAPFDLPEPHACGSYLLEYEPNGLWLACREPEGCTFRWSTNGARMGGFKAPPKSHAIRLPLQFDASGTRCACAIEPHRIVVLDVPSGRLVRDIRTVDSIEPGSEILAADLHGMRFTATGDLLIREPTGVSVFRIPPRRPWSVPAVPNGCEAIEIGRSLDERFVLEAVWGPSPPEDRDGPSSRPLRIRACDRERQREVADISVEHGDFCYETDRCDFRFHGRTPELLEGSCSPDGRWGICFQVQRPNRVRGVFFDLRPAGNGDAAPLVRPFSVKLPAPPGDRHTKLHEWSATWADAVDEWHLALKFGPAEPCAAADGPYATIVLEAPTGRVIRRAIREAPAGVYDGLFQVSADGTRCVMSDVMLVWDSRTGRTLIDPKFMGTGALSPDGRLVAQHDVWTGFPLVRIVEVDGGSTRAEIAWEGFNPVCMAFSPDGERLAILNYSGVRLYETRQGEPVGFLPLEGAEYVRFSPDGRRLFALRKGPPRFHQRNNSRFPGDPPPKADSPFADRQVFVWDATPRLPDEPIPPPLPNPLRFFPADAIPVREP